MRFFIIIALLIIAGCDRHHYTTAEIAGKYVLSGDGMTDALELKADNTYIHAHSDKDGSQTQSGNWAVELVDDRDQVVLNDFENFATPYKQKSIYLLAIEKSSDKIQLITNIDLGVGYSKQ